MLERYCTKFTINSCTTCPAVNMYYYLYGEIEIYTKIIQR